MKILSAVLLVGSMLTGAQAHAKCDVDELRRDMIEAYDKNLPVNDEKGVAGMAKAKNIVVSDYLMKVETDNFLIANFDLDITWKNGDSQTVKTMVVSTVNLNKCTLEPFKTGDSLSDSLSSK
ncbi:MAG TPA: hypothetical protein VNJ01_11495 [Bacteriovoracaceae bacterium]|nr:hypothetical protein [Bacteriovoracaceae bacterium]